MKIFDTTLREGLQTPGVGASLEERVQIAKLLWDFYQGLAIMEIGMPANEVDYPVLQAIMKQVPGPQYAFLLRCNDLDIDRARDVFKEYPDNMAHLFIGTSEQHRKVRFNGNKSISDYCGLIKEKVELVAADPHIKQVMFSPEDALRTFWEGHDNGNGEVLSRFIQAAVDGYTSGNAKVNRLHKMIFNLPDTVGIGTVQENEDMVRYVKQRFPDVELSVHFHDDLDMATASTVNTVIKRLVDYPQVAFAGSGERNGIGRAEPTIVALNERNVINLADAQAYSLTKTSRTIAHLLGMPLDTRYPVTGIDVNVSASGIHAQLARKDHDTYHFMGERYGNPVRILFGTTSGSDTAKWFLEKNGYPVHKEKIQAYTAAMKYYANSIKDYLTETEMAVFAEQIINQRTTNGLRIADAIPMISLQQESCPITIIGELDGTHFTTQGSGVGPVDAVFKTLSKYLGYDRAALATFKPVVKGMGSEAKLQVMSEISYQEKSYWGRGMDSSTTKAELKSIIQAFEHMHFLHPKTL